jgi:adenine-specific DNA-methyltransferase
LKKCISRIKKKFPKASVGTIERAFIDSYGKQNKLSFQYTFEIKKFLSIKDYYEISDFISDNISLSGLDELVVAFECLVTEDDKKNKGVVYTPPEIRRYIAEEIIITKHVPRIIDPACGCGAFLVSASQIIYKKYKLSYKDIYNKYIWGCDIDSHSIDKCKILLELLCFQNEGKVYKCKFNFIEGNALELLSQEVFCGKYDVVIGNPPYVRSKNIEKNIKKTFEKWDVVSGNVDLYIPFYQLGIELLNKNGTLGYISPNTYLQSVNGRALRNYVKNTKCDLKIINFKETQKFADATHYTCITFIFGYKRNNKIEYAVCEENLKNCQFTTYDISQNPYNMEWRFCNREIDQMVYQIEHQPDKLDNYNIRNGLATLCNDLFIFEVIKETKHYYIRIYEGQEYKIEKDICISIAKPNIMRCETDLIQKGEKAIYPYIDGKIIPETVFEKKYPYAYLFLAKYKNKLLGRDKGKVDDYQAWYAYGRTQGMNNQGTKLLIPYMADRGVAILSQDYDLLFYCGYAVFSEDVNILKILKIFIESDVFWFYIKMTSKPYSKGYMALAKNYIKNFGIPSLSKIEAKQLVQSKGEAREILIAKLYNLDYKLICQYIEKSPPIR